MSIRGLDAVSGEPVFIESFAGDGSELDPYVMQRADPIAHAKLDLIKSEIEESNATWLFHTNFGLASSVVKGTSGKIRSFVLTNNSISATCYLLFFNATTAPGAGASTLAFPPFPIHMETVFALGQNELGTGLPFDTAISYGISSTPNTFTAIATPSEIRLIVGYQ